MHVRPGTKGAADNTSEGDKRDPFRRCHVKALIGGGGRERDPVAVKFPSLLLKRDRKSSARIR